MVWEYGYYNKHLEALLDLEQERISWPQGSRLATIIQGFEYGKTEFGNHKLSNVIDAMDESHIPIRAPSKNGSRYINCKSFHSINLLGVVDHQGRFIYIHVGEAEISLHPEQWVPGGIHIIADAAYPL
ncbi:14386_t:CDS:2 [Acaulospora morrowiae]|uniref:14386_t:CDS:1 n=1 Tax=Acaulospora morrowiae TaxID=94023 RepID=A0A9N9BC69_9GLOM|nr:14386_t:CDS:2 [Acaulospora morrowiae]